MDTITTTTLAAIDKARELNTLKIVRHVLRSEFARRLRELNARINELEEPKEATE